MYAISVSRLRCALNLTQFMTGSKQIVNRHAQPKVCVEKVPHNCFVPKYLNNEYISQDVRSVIGLYT